MIRPLLILSLILQTGPAGAQTKLEICERALTSKFAAEKLSDVAEGKRAFLDEPAHLTLDQTTLANLEYGPLVAEKLTEYAYTEFGKHRLRWMLNHPYTDSAYIRARQEAVIELAENDELMNLLEQEFIRMSFSLAHTRPEMSRKADQQMTPANELGPVTQGRVVLRSFTEPITAMLAAGTALMPIEFAHRHSWGMMCVGGLLAMLTQGVMISAMFYEPDRPASMLAFDAAAKLYIDARKLMPNARSSVLQDIQTVLDLASKENSADVPQDFRNPLPMMAKIASLGANRDLSMRMWRDANHIGRLVEPLARVVGHWNRARLAAYFGAMGELESLFVAAKFYRQYRSQLIFPTVLNASEKPQLRMMNAHHPYQIFFGGKNSIGNSVELTADGTGAKSIIVTGPNAGGKTTFMRMIALNAILAQLGFPVPAQSMELTPLKVYTNFEVLDSTANSTSTFRAQARRAAEIFRELENENIPSLVVLDEILNGTSTNEHYAAERAVVEELHKRPATLLMLATHDRELTQLADALPGIANLHVIDAGFRVDDGPSTTNNAFQILRDSGVPPHLIQEMNRLLEQRGSP